MHCSVRVTFVYSRDDLPVKSSGGVFIGLGDGGGCPFTIGHIFFAISRLFPYERHTCAFASE